MRGIFKVGIISIVCILGIAGASYFTLFEAPGHFPSQAVVTIERGQSLNSVAADLRFARIVRSSSAFSGLSRLFGARKGLLPGSYRLGKNENAVSLAWRFTHASYLMSQSSSSSEPLQPGPAGHSVRNFEPHEFHRVFSDSICPALNIKPGDAVRTWTLDSAGNDSKSIRRSLRGNPQTGPFYVDGAAPGDTLIVHLLKVRLNRSSAHSGNSIAESALEKSYLQRTVFKNDFDSSWLLDLDAGVARPKNPIPTLKNFSVALRPMLGCVAVAPPNHAVVSTASLGPFGGNLDFSQVTEGATVYLPVFAPGALFFIGDGHAAQGDGELTGDALETSMQVEFSVGLKKGQSSAFPRIENADYLMASGISSSMPAALQAATSNLARWLERDYGLRPNEIALVLGGAIQYQIAEIVDPQIHIVAKLPKSVLARLR